MKKDYPQYQKLHEKSIREWRKDPNLQPLEEELKKKRKHIWKLKPTYGIKAEEKVVEKIKQIRQEKKPVSRKNIITWAKDIFGDPQFNGSPGWFDKFKKRWKLFLRIATHVIQQLRKNYQLSFLLLTLKVTPSCDPFSL